MIAVVDYDAGNIKSVEKALQFIGADPVITREPSLSGRIKSSCPAWEPLRMPWGR